MPENMFLFLFNAYDHRRLRFSVTLCCLNICPPFIEELRIARGTVSQLPCMILESAPARRRPVDHLPGTLQQACFICLLNRDHAFGCFQPFCQIVKLG
jgi:hypothetical protein